MSTKIQLETPINLQLHSNGTATLHVGDVDFGRFVNRIELDLRAGHVGQLVLHCNVLNGQISGPADVITQPFGDRTLRPLPRRADGSPVLPPCEVCGQPSDGASVDTLDVTAADAKAKSFVPLYPVHYFCPEHHREPLRYSLQRAPYEDG